MRFVHGSMRLQDEARAVATINAAVAAGITTFDTARAYGDHERILGRALRHEPVTIITKCGMVREGAAFIPDGRASRILEDARASCEALGRPPDLLLLHVPDPRVSFATSIRALARARDRGLAKAIGVSNVSRKQLAEALDLAPISAVQSPMSSFRSGVFALAVDRDLSFYLHSPLGGPERAARTSNIEAFLAYLLAVHPAIRPVVGAHRPETVASLARAASLHLDDATVAGFDSRFPILGALHCPPAPVAASDAEVVILMGIPGAGKSRAAAAYVARGYERLNRDTLGGTLRGIAARLGERLREGGQRFVLDNTYVTRAVRSDVVRVAHAHGASVRCVFFDTPRADAERNVLMRMIARFGRLIDPAERSDDPAALGPHVVSRMVRDLEPPEADEGFAAIERVPFVREPDPQTLTPTLVIALGNVIDDAFVRAALAAHPALPVLLVAWRPSPDAALISYAAAIGAELAVCTHPAGPLQCWCRPPQLGLLAERHVDLDRSVIVRAGSNRGD